MVEELSIVGKRMPDVTGIEKVTGAAKFISDIQLPGMLIGKVLTSPYAHARVVHIDIARVEKLPGVMAVITAKDAPKKQYSGTLMNLQSYSGIAPWGAYDVRVLDNKVRYVGDTVAAIAAVNEKVAEEAIELIKVEYEQLPAVFDEMIAVRDGSPRIHDSVMRWQHDGIPREEAVGNNLALHIAQKSRADVEKGFQEADYIVEEQAYTTQQRQASLEKFCCIAVVDAAGKITLWSQTQLPYLMRRMIAYIFDIPEGMIRIKNEFTGGAFGAGLSVLTEPLCILLARKSGRPVKLVYSRQQEFSSRQTRSCVSPYIFKMGVKKDGTITAVERKVIARAGAYTECAGCCAFVGMSKANPLYRVGSYKAEANVVYTNRVPCGAMRGFGNPEETFIREQVMDIAALKIGIDPLEFRLKNICQLGDPGPFGPQFPITSTGLADCIKMGAAKIGWNKKKRTRQKGYRCRGIGVSCTAHNSGTWPGGVEHSNALIKFNEDASIVLSVSPAPIGTNALTSLAQVAAEVLGLSLTDVHVLWGDTDVNLFEIGSHASRSIYIIGNAVYKAAIEARRKLLTRAARKLGVTADDVYLKDKKIFVKGDPRKVISVTDVLKDSIYNLHEAEQVIGSCSFSPNTSPPAYQALFVEVEVDIETGEVEVIKMVMVNDSGRSINPMIVEGQLEGATAQGLGYSLWEEPVLDASTGRLLTDDFDTYKVATTLDMPTTEIVLLDQADPTGPFGAKGVGELGCINQAAAIANAIYDAIGVRIWELPITPEKIIRALKNTQPL